MIKKISVRNFLSLKEVDLELRHRNFLVGPNMSGKSNLIDCFKFLATMATSGQGLLKAFLDRGGFEEVAWKGAREPRISFDVTAELHQQLRESPKTYHYSVSILGGQSGQIAVESEQLTLEDRRGSRTILNIAADGKGQVEIEEAKGVEPVNLGDRSRSAFDYVGLVSKSIEPFLDLISSLRAYQLVPPLMRTGGAPVPQKFLAEHGDNLSTWLMTLQRDTEEFRRIRQVASEVFPDLTDVLLEPTQFGTVSITTREKHLKEPIGISRMSDGQLAFLALLSLIFAPERLSSPLYCIEEPENYLHPYLLETLVEVLTQRQADLGTNAQQIIATTHSPHLVDKLNLDDLVVVEKSAGCTRLTRPSSAKKLRELLSRKKVGLGDLWYSEALSSR